MPNRFYYRMPVSGRGGGYSRNRKEEIGAISPIELVLQYQADLAGPRAVIAQQLAPLKIRNKSWVPGDKNLLASVLSDLGMALDPDYCTFLDLRDQTGSPSILRVAPDILNVPQKRKHKDFRIALGGKSDPYILFRRLLGHFRRFQALEICHENVKPTI